MVSRFHYCAPQDTLSNQLMHWSIAFVLLLAKLSDILGLKSLILGSNAVFFIFSVACGVARTMDQL